MPSVSRVHTAVAWTLMALVPVTPLALWLYARATSVEPGPLLAANARLFQAVPHLGGARPLGRAHAYPVPRWGNEGGLVPTARYRTEFFLRMPQAVEPRLIAAHYRRELAGWRMRRVGSSSAFVLTRRGVEIDLEPIDIHAGRTRDYGFYVSQ